MALEYCQNHETSGNILVPLLAQEELFKLQYIAFFRAYLDTILKALGSSIFEPHFAQGFSIFKAANIPYTPAFFWAKCSTVHV